MGTDAPTYVIADTSTLVNFLRVGRVDLLAGLTSYRFAVTNHVRAEVTAFYPAQLASFEFALMAGHIVEITLDAPAELVVFGELKRLRLGDGECASIAAALSRATPLAIDDIRARKKCLAEDRAFACSIRWASWWKRFRLGFSRSPRPTPSRLIGRKTIGSSRSTF